LDTNPSLYLALEVEYPPNYPQEIPLLEVENDDGSFLAQQDDDDVDDEMYHDVTGEAEKFERQDFIALEETLIESAGENIGMPSVFTLASLLKDKAEEMIGNKINRREKQREKLLAEQEEKEQQKFRGTPITPETFAAWRAKFRHEFNLDDKKVERPKGKMTGKEIFERGLNKEEEEEEEEGQQDEEQDEEQDGTVSEITPGVSQINLN